MKTEEEAMNAAEVAWRQNPSNKDIKYEPEWAFYGGWEAAMKYAIMTVRKASVK